MILPFLIAIQAAAPAPAPASSSRFDACAALALTDPAAARVEATRWAAADGKSEAHQCAGLAYTTDRNWTAAAAEFETAARAADTAHDAHAATYWAQAGNARLAAGDFAPARDALDHALLSGKLSGLALGEARLDHARVMVATGNLDAARTDLDLALAAAPDDPLAWLLSATLARRTGDPARAAKDIGEALRRSPDDASVQLEAGNIAALAGDEAAAREAWANAARIAPRSDVGRSAVAALRQFDDGTGTLPAAVKPVEGR